MNVASSNLGLSSGSAELQVEDGYTVTYGGTPRLVDSNGFDLSPDSVTLSPEAKSVLQAVETGSYTEAETSQGDLVGVTGTGARFTTSSEDDLTNWSKDANGRLTSEVNFDWDFVSWNAGGQSGTLIFIKNNMTLATDSSASLTVQDPSAGTTTTVSDEFYQSPSAQLISTTATVTKSAAHVPTSSSDIALSLLRAEGGRSDDKDANNPLERLYA